METIEISKSEYDELNFYKKLVENNLQEELTEAEIAQILKAKKTKSLTEEEFLDLNNDLK